jgi:hypothetical protein
MELMKAQAARVVQAQQPAAPTAPTAPAAPAAPAVSVSAALPAAPAALAVSTGPNLAGLQPAATAVSGASTQTALPETVPAVPAAVPAGTQPTVTAMSMSDTGTQSQLADLWGNAVLIKVQTQLPIPPATAASLLNAVHTQLAASRPYRETIELAKAQARGLHSSPFKHNMSRLCHWYHATHHM